MLLVLLMTPSGCHHFCKIKGTDKCNGDHLLKSEGSVAQQKMAAGGLNELDHRESCPVSPLTGSAPFSSAVPLAGSSSCPNCVIKSLLSEPSSWVSTIGSSDHWLPG